MKKAMMYLLLALGISLGVVFVGGAVISFSAGFIDGFNDGYDGAAPGTTDSKTMILSSGMVLVLLTCVVLNIVFLRLRYASYTVGRIPKEKRWQVVAWLLLAMLGLALLYCMMYNPLADPDESISSTYLWIKQHPLVSLPYIILIEATGDLIFFGGVMREILEWKHRPQIVIPIFGAIIALFTAIFSSPFLMIPAMMLATIEGWVYEYSRSVIPVIIADAFYWVVMVCLMGITLPWWCYFLACVLIVPGAYFAINTMEPYKPID